MFVTLHYIILLLSYRIFQHSNLDQHSDKPSVFTIVETNIQIIQIFE